MKTQHFTSGGYMTIQNEIGRYSFKGTGREDLIMHMEELRKTNERIHRQVLALQAVLNHESECSPQALRH